MSKVLVLILSMFAISSVAQAKTYVQFCNCEYASDDLLIKETKIAGYVEEEKIKKGCTSENSEAACKELGFSFAKMNAIRKCHRRAEHLEANVRRIYNCKKMIQK